MSIVVRFKPANLTAQKYDESHPAVEQADFPPEGLDYHACFGMDPEHLTVSEIWDPREQMEACREADADPHEYGIEMAGEPEVFEVHNIIKAAAAQPESHHRGARTWLRCGVVGATGFSLNQRPFGPQRMRYQTAPRPVSEKPGYREEVRRGPPAVAAAVVVVMLSLRIRRGA